MRKKNTDFGDHLRSIAELLANQAAGDEITIEQRIAAFKEIRAYYVMLHKLNPDEGASFGGFAEQIAGTQPRARGNGSRRPAAIDVEPGADPDF